jgi:hypothetical protein
MGTGGPAPAKPAQWLNLATEGRSTEPEELVHRCFVGGREREPVELVARHPAKGVHVDGAELTGNDAALVKMKVDDVMLIGVAHERDELSHFDVDREPVAHFALQRVGVAFARLDAAAGELPEKWQYGGRTPLRDEIAPALGDDRGNDSDRWARGRHGETTMTGALRS